jgi:hypothetical protein
MGSQRWTRWVAIGAVVAMALVGSLLGTLGLAGRGDDSPASADRQQATSARSGLVLPLAPLGWTHVRSPTAADSARQAAVFGERMGARVVYAEYAHGRSSLAVTGLEPAPGTDFNEALSQSPGRAIGHQFVNAGLGEGTPFPSGVAGVTLRCGQARRGVSACIWADRRVMGLMTWKLHEGGLAQAARLTRSLIPSFRQPS